ncbi:hypothetical protein BV25DRAFT_1819465 [Artomyces pyxidatus]|uniref:Uncharacterized protein n=1 Tax=Artomyces pyxidatus TaxID=48021 RepID=A0ACB8TFD8_9AGAM|nr:hypothetical protein BV25DRAFT_1819465 [Artomyces pyxidatus]
MDTPHLQIPRLRLSRQGHSPSEESQNTPTAGPSRLAHDDQEDMDSTPRMPLNSFPSPQATSSPNPTDDTPVSRLRALLSRVPNTSQSQLLHERVPSLASDLESDFDPPPKWNTTNGSMARENLKGIFSHALRESGDTPRKYGRRNSIDASEVEDSPRVQRVAQERSKNKGKRKSLSDEESSKNPHTFSSHAANMEALRNRLLGTQNVTDTADTSDDLADTSNDTATLLHQMNGSSSAMQSVQFPSNYQNESNLLEQDSEMQRAMGATDSFEGESSRPSFPPPLLFKAPVLAARPRSTLFRAESLTETNLSSNASRRNMALVARRDSEDPSSRPSSSADSPRPPGTPHRDSYHYHRASHSQTGSPLPEPSRSRRGSVVSLRSVDSDLSSRPSSIGSNAEYHERLKDGEKERQHERERAWNKPAASRSSSSLSLHHSNGRPHTHSHPTRPDSAQSLLTPDRNSFSRQSSRSTSPNGSTHSRDTEPEEEVVVVHERERNWNAPHPKWSHGRPVSPMPSSSLSHSRVRTQSLGGHSPQTPPLARPPAGRIKKSPSQTSLNVPPHPVSPSPHSRHHDSRSMKHSPRAPSPLPPNSGKVNGKASSTVPGFTSHFGWHFPRNRAQLPPLELDQSSPERPSSPAQRPSSRSSISSTSSVASRPSHIPVRSPGKVPKVESSKNGEASRYTKGHKRATTEFTEANGAVPPKIHLEAEPDSESSSIANGDADSLQESDVDMQDVVTPVIRPIVIPPPEDVHPSSPPSPERRQAVNDLARLQKALESSPSKSSPPASPRLSTPPPKMEPMLDLVTPPRRSSFSSSKLEFQTPSPPKGLPELPGPPSSSDDDELDDADRTPVLQNGAMSADLSNMKTPRPPGAWAATPAPVRQQVPETPAPSSSVQSRGRSNSLPQPTAADDLPLENGDAKTPVLALTRANTLPTRTPAPPGAWLMTPGTLRRKSLMKVRFENATSDSARSENGDVDASLPDEVKTEHPRADWEASPSKVPDFDLSLSEPSFNGVAESSPVPASGLNHGEENPFAPRSESPKTPSETPRRKLRKSPSIRLVDEYGRDQDEKPVTPARKEVSMSMRMPGGTLVTPRNKSAVRMLDAMGREVEEASEQNDSEDTVTQGRISRAEALARVRKAVSDLQEGLSSVDHSDDLAFDEARMGELHDLSRNARDARSKLSSSLKQAQSAQASFRYGSLKESMRKSRFMPNFLPEPRLSWNSSLFWCIFFMQFVLFLAMYRMSKQHAKNQFLTTYYDPFYAELHLHPTKREMNYDANLFAFVRRASYADSAMPESLLSLWHDVFNTVAGWQRQAWETWGERPQALGGTWPPT